MLIEDELIVTLQKSNIEWSQFQSEYLKDHTRIEISQWVIADRDMKGYHFINCDFRGAIISNVNFDDSTFTNCRIYGCSLELLSLVQIKAEKITLEDVQIERCTVRKSSFIGIELTQVTGNEVAIIDSNINNLNCMELSIEGGSLIGVVEENIHKKGSKFQNIQVENIFCDKIELSECRMHKCSCGNVEIENMNIHGGEIDGCKIVNLQANDSKITYANIRDFQFEKGNFINGLFIGVDLKEIGIEKIGLMQTAVVDCEWPTQTYRVSWWGKYIPSKYLLKQPVEDVIGISPKLRNEIQRAQLVDETHKASKNFPAKMWLWFWGMTTEYGRSLARLTTLYAFIVMILILMFIIYFPNETLGNSFGECFRETCQYIIFNFIGISADTQVVFSVCLEQNIILVIDRILGIIFIGLWTGIAANKIGSIN